MKSFTFPKPDDWHCHLRDNAALQLTVTHQAKQFYRAIVMPNLSDPVTTVAQALSYRDRIRQYIPANINFEPLMTLYLTDQTSTEEIQKAKECEFIHAFKLYPAGATTGSAKGVSQLTALDPLLATLEEVDMPLLMHGEITDPSSDIFLREQRFIEDHLENWVKKFPKLRMVLEHITSKYAVQFIEDSPSNVAATITAHHLLINRNDLFVQGIHPHYYCLPIVKTQSDQRALIDAAISGNPKFFLGTDSAPHKKSQKESACGCAGIYTAHAAIELYAMVFDTAQALDKLRGFACEFGADFYQLARNNHEVELIRQTQTIPDTFDFCDESLIPFYAGQDIPWQLQEREV